MARIARLLPVMASGAVQLLENGLGFMQRHLLAVFQMGAFTPKDRDNRLRCRILRDLPLGVGNGNLTFDLAFHKRIHLALLQLIAPVSYTHLDVYKRQVVQTDQVFFSHGEIHSSYLHFF